MRAFTLFEVLMVLAISVTTLLPVWRATVSLVYSSAKSCMSDIKMVVYHRAASLALCDDLFFSQEVSVEGGNIRCKKETYDAAWQKVTDTLLYEFRKSGLYRTRWRMARGMVKKSTIWCAPSGGVCVLQKNTTSWDIAYTPCASIMWRYRIPLVEWQ